MDKQTAEWLWMLLVFGTANKHLPAIISYYKNIDDAYSNLSDPSKIQSECDAGKFEFSSQIKRRLYTTPIDQCKMIYEYCKSQNIGIISYDDECYPSFLRNIFDPPAVLFYMGNKEVLQNPVSLTVVGTRHASDYSLRVSKAICSDLAKDGFVLVSGFANGIDWTSQNAAIQSGGQTVSILGSGIDVDYPKGSLSRKNAVIESGGVIISEYLPGTTPNRANFPKRNRILAAISLGTIVFQAPKKSGSLITAGLALDLGKEVFCVPPHDIFDESYLGVVQYLQDGAIPVFSHLDVVNAFYFSYAHDMSAKDVLSGSINKNIDFDTEKNLKKENKINSDNLNNPENQEENYKNFKPEDETQKKIIDLFYENESIHSDEIAEKTGLDIADILMALTEMEIAGVVKQCPGKIYKRK